jgi:hypothetical protein
MNQRLSFLKSDYMECLKLAVSNYKSEENTCVGIIEQANRVKKLLYDRQLRNKKEIIDDEGRYPIIVELEALKFNLKKNSSSDVHLSIL